ncbi:MAG: VWA domain-containing protein [Ardenticatenales bacterium]
MTAVLALGLQANAHPLARSVLAAPGVNADVVPSDAADPATLTTTCTATTTMTATPPRVPLGATVDVTLNVAGSCPPAGGDVTPADIVLLLDRSASMRDNSLFAPAIEAIRTFVQLTDFSVHQVAVLTFYTPALSLESRVDVNQPLSNDQAAVLAAVNAIPIPPAYTTWTDLTSAIDGAQAELTGPRHRADATPVMVLVTDGEHNALTAETPVETADRARAAGTTIFAIGIGVQATARIQLQQVAGDPERYFDSPTADDLREAYRRIAGSLSAPGEIRDMQVSVLMPAAFSYVQDSAVPPPTTVGSASLLWRVDRLPGGGWTATYKIRADQLGLHAVSKLAYADYIDADGTVASRPFTVPEVEVVAPGTPIPTVEPTATRVPPTPDGLVHVFLPVAYKNYCTPSRPFDVVLAIDTSTSMAGDKLTRAIEAAREFVGYLQLPPSRGAIVGFNSAADIVKSWTDDRAALLGGLDKLSSAEGTRIDLVLRKARVLFESREASADREAVLILLTDGKHAGSPVQDVYNEAAAFRRGDVKATVYTISIGADADTALLEYIAGDPARHFNAPGAEDLVRIYREIAGGLPCD